MGSVNAAVDAPVVAIAPVSRTMPPLTAAPARPVENGALVQAFSRASGVKSDAVNVAPSSDVKHWALDQLPPGATTTEAEPVGEMNSRPFAEPHRSIGR